MDKIARQIKKYDLLDTISGQIETLIKKIALTPEEEVKLAMLKERDAKKKTADTFR
jgi:hypothetical protein